MCITVWCPLQRKEPTATPSRIKTKQDQRRVEFRAESSSAPYISKDPKRALSLLVRRSVANNLNDLGKVHAELAPTSGANPLVYESQFKMT